jgi:general secretion pathway protein F
MTVFAYVAKANPQQTVHGTVRADSRGSAADSLRCRGLFAINIEPESDIRKDLPWFNRIRLPKVRLNALAQFTEQLANLLDAGVPLERILRLLQHQNANPTLRRTLARVRQSVCKGDSLAQALSGLPDTFSAAYVSMVNVGEAAAVLPQILHRLAKSLDQQHQLRCRLRAAMLYPIFLSCVGLGTVIVLMVWVIPKFGAFFSSLEHQLPAPTRFVIRLSSLAGRTWPFILILALITLLLIVRLLKNETVRFVFDRASLRIPVAGDVILKTQLARLMQTLGILLSHGVNMLSALSIAAQTISNKFIAHAVRNARQAVAAGEKLDHAFACNNILPATVLDAIAIAQQSAMLPEILVRLADQYEQQTERRLKTLTSMLEPVMILIMGTIVGLIVVAMLMPIFKATALVQ